MCDAGDEVAAAIAGGERGHGGTIGLGGIGGCAHFRFGGRERFAEGLFPDFATVRDCVVGKGGVGFVDRVRGSAGCVDHKNASPFEGGIARKRRVGAGAEVRLDLVLFLIVRQEGEIIGKLGETETEGLRD